MSFKPPALNTGVRTMIASTKPTAVCIYFLYFSSGSKKNTSEENIIKSTIFFIQANNIQHSFPPISEKRLCMYPDGQPAFHLASNVISVREMINKKEAHQMPRSIKPMVCAIMLMPSENRLSPKGCTNADTIRRVR